jgi:hypothetical protein
LGIANLHINNLSVAEEIFQNILKVESKDISSMFNLGKIYIQKRQADSAF